MRTIRLLPVLLLAGTALLVFKSVGLLTNGGYVLVGTSTAAAAGDTGGGHAAPAATESGEPLTLSDPTMTDESPTIADTAPTLEEGGGAGHGEASGAEHAEEAPTEVAQADTAPATEEPASSTEEPTVGAEDHSAPAPEGGEGDATATNCGPNEFVVDENGMPIEDADCPPAGNGVPIAVDQNGQIVPLSGDTTVSATEKQILERLSTRRDDLDSFAAELAMREALIQAAEKRLDERTQQLQAMEQQISSTVDQKNADEEAQFVGLVKLYESMKPADAAQIFDKLDMSVLLRVARKMNPKKLAPVMAKMDPMVAQQLTVNIALNEPDPSTIGPASDQLPQIVGQ